MQGTAPGGAPIGAAVTKTAKPDIYAVDFAVKPGDTRFDVSYTVPYKEGETFAGKVATKDDNTYLIVPNGVAIKAEGLNDLGAEPRTQAHIWGLTGDSLQGRAHRQPGARRPKPSAEGSDKRGPRSKRSCRGFIRPPRSSWSCALGILALGFALLYRASARTRRNAEVRR